MADNTELRCWPACTEAIDWSEDGVIALASDERVELLFPNTISFERDNDVPQWQHIPLAISLFSTDELYIKEPASLSIYSIGEEISTSVPTALSWSPPGLAKHRRCALAILTSNLVLSIWSASRNFQEESNWKRALIINHALADYFLMHVKDQSNHGMLNDEQQLRLRTRIRAFAWAPILPNLEMVNLVGTCLTYDQQLMVVSNDDNQLAIVLVESPASSLGTHKTWTSKVICHFSVMIEFEHGCSDAESCEDVLGQQTHILHVAWSPWVVRDSKRHSVLTYATNEDVRARSIIHTSEGVELGREIIYLKAEMRYKGSLKWCPKTNIGDPLILAVYTESGLYCFQILAVDGFVMHRTVHGLDERWDPISGAVWETTALSMPRLHVSSLLSTLHSPTSLLELSNGGLKAIGSPNWRDQIDNNLMLFSVKNDLMGNCRAKVWGLSTSPLGDFIVACNSLHPSDMIEYGPSADRRTTIAISTLRKYSEMRKSFPARDITAEGLLFTLKKTAENTIEDEDQISTFITEVVHELSKLFTPPRAMSTDHKPATTYSDVENLHSVVNEFKMFAFLNPFTLKDRYTILASQACNSTASGDLCKMLIAFRLAVNFIELPASLVCTTFSNEVLNHHHQLLSLAGALTGLGTQAIEQPEDQGIVTTRFHNSDAAGLHLTDHPETAHTKSASVWVAKCDFCTAPIPFTDLTSAACLNGHRFPRCGLTFLAIQAPGITKYCEICRTPFLSEEFVVAQEAKPMLTDTSKSASEEANIANKVPTRKTSTSVGHIDDSELTENYASLHGSQIDTHRGRQNVLGIDVNKTTSNDRRPKADATKHSTTLAKVLFLACDVCIYCGGKFVG